MSHDVPRLVSPYGQVAETLKIQMGSEKFRNCLELAETIFAGQMRKSGLHPKMDHNKEVARLVMLAGGDEDAWCAGLLHDAIEDGKEPKDVIRRKIRDTGGVTILQLVVEVTDTPEMKKLPRSQKKIVQARLMESASPDAKLIKEADQLDNVREVAIHPPQFWDQNECLEYLYGALRVVNACRHTSPFLETMFCNEWLKVFHQIRQK